MTAEPFTRKHHETMRDTLRERYESSWSQWYDHHLKRHFHPLLHEEQMTMAKIELELQPFTVPNFVLAKTGPYPRQDGPIEAPKFALSDLSSDVLEELCTQFRHAVMVKAGYARAGTYTHARKPE